MTELSLLAKVTIVLFVSLVAIRLAGVRRLLFVRWC